MLYILPPPSQPAPPSPWNSIVLCASQKIGGNTEKFSTRLNGNTRKISARIKQAGKFIFNQNNNNNNINNNLKNLKKDSGNTDDEESSRINKSLSECYFAGKGTALMLGSNERLLRICDGRRLSSVSMESSGTQTNGKSDIQQHLQSMFYLLRPEETLKMAVKLESLRAGRTRYLVVVSRPSKCRSHSQQQNTNVVITEQQDREEQLSPPPQEQQLLQPPPQLSIFDDNNVQTGALPATTTNTTSCSSYSFSNQSTTTIIMDQCSCYQNYHNYNPNNNNSSNNSISNVNLSNCDDNNVDVTTTVTAVTTTNISVNHCDNKNLVNNFISDKCGNCGGITNFNSYNNNSCNVSNMNSSNNEIEESCLLGIDCNEKTTVGLVLKVLADTTIRLDGDGGFSVSICGQQHIFKPVSVQAMWSALQTLHKVSSKAREHNFFAGGASHEWVSYYEDHIGSDRSCLNEWHAMDALESRRPPSPDSIRNKPTEREETERVIRTALKEIMMSVDLDEVTSKYIRIRLEEHLDMDLDEYKSFIDEEMLVILGQMDSPTEIFDHVYLGSEWNASNLEELQKNGVRHILNVTREIDNFFPGMFEYFNVRVYDDEKTDLLKHWDNTFKYISRAKMEGSKVLVHCKMGISRSASVVIAYAMKANNWDFDQALRHVKQKRNCIKPNRSFVSQLETYQGMLDAMKNKEKLQRSKSETNLKSSTKDGRSLPGSEPTPLIQALHGSRSNTMNLSGKQLKKIGERPKSWSPDERKESGGLQMSKPQSQSLEHLNEQGESEQKTVRHQCGNGQNYSVSQNQIFYLEESSPSSLQSTVPSSQVKSIINELESNVFKTKDDKNKKEDPGGPIIITNNNSGEDKENCDSPINWTSSAQIIHQSSKIVVVQPQKPGDPFSAQVDKVFEREEKRQSRIIPPAINEIITEDQIVSRQSSWSSVDSAVVLGYPGELTRELPSRHSSWGSGDNRTTPSRNSSWGSYDMKTLKSIKLTRGNDDELMMGQSGIFPYDKDDIPWHPGTVKRTKQKIEERSSSTKRICCDKSNDKASRKAENSKKGRSCSEETLSTTQRTDTNQIYSRLSASAPGSFSFANFHCEEFQPGESKTAPAICRRYSFKTRTPMEIDPKADKNIKEVEEEDNGSDENSSVQGIVKNLKMNFEAKASDKEKKEGKKGRSLPSSPVAIHVDMKDAKADALEEINVKGLVKEYEVTKMRTNTVSSTAAKTTQVTVKPRPKSVYVEPLKYAQNNKPFMINHSTIITRQDEFARPPIPLVRGIVLPPNSTNNNNQQNVGGGKKVQQHGKTHPLARITLAKQRLNTTSAAYNTM